MPRISRCVIRLLVLCGAVLAFSPAITAASAQRGWEVDGQLTGIVTGWYGAVIAVPVLRIGTISGMHGTFKLRATAPGGCYEAIVRTAYRHLTHLWFSAPDSGFRDLGDIEIAPLPNVEGPFDSPQPVVHDTIGSCRPARLNDTTTTWPSVHAILQGQLLRGARSLPNVPLDLACTGGGGSSRTRTDSAGRFRFYYAMSFPDDQSLADGREAACRLSIATSTLDEPRPVVLTFGPDDATAPEQQTIWTLPEPDLRPRRVIGLSPDRSPLRLDATASFSPGVFTAPQTVALELVERPARIELYDAGMFYCPPSSRSWNWQKCDYRMGRRAELRGLELLPATVRVTTGQKQATTGSDLIIAVPTEYAIRAAAGARFEAFARLPARYRGAPDAFVRLSVGYLSSLQILNLSLVDADFDDERTTDHAYEAIIVLGLRGP
jgi:hypothetical protein